MKSNTEQIRIGSNEFDKPLTKLCTKLNEYHNAGKQQGCPKQTCQNEFPKISFNRALLISKNGPRLLTEIKNLVP